MSSFESEVKLVTRFDSFDIRGELVLLCKANNRTFSCCKVLDLARPGASLPVACRLKKSAKTNASSTKLQRLF